MTFFLYLRFLFPAYVCLVFPYVVSAQQYNFRNYSVDEGLAQSQVYAMCEDKNGHIWFGTRGGGLSRFDGINFSNYTVQEGLPGNYIRCLYKDRIGDLWIGTDNGLVHYDGRKFEVYAEPEGLYNPVVNSILCDRKGIYWIATEEGIFHRSKDTVVRFGRKLGAPKEHISSLWEDRQGRIWAGTDFGLYCFEEKGGQYTMSRYTVKEGLPANIVTSVIEDPRGILWICTYGGGVAFFDGKKFERFQAAGGLSGNTVFTAATGNEGEIWFGTSNGATRSYYQRPDSAFSHFTETEGLAGNVVMSILKDSFGNIWLGTSGGGVSRLSGERFVHYPAIKGVMGNWVYAIVEDSTGHMWFGTSEGGVTRYDGRYYKRFSEKDGFTASKVKCIHEDRSGNLWMGTISDGLYLYHDNTFRQFSGKNGLSSNFINYILSDTSGRIWLATAGGGICIMTPDGQGDYRIRHIKPRDGLAGDRIHTMLEDRQGTIWAGTSGGLSRIIPGNDSVPLKILNYTTKQGLSGNQIRCSAAGADGALYFGTSDAGVIVYDGQRFTSFGKVQGLASNTIYSLIFEDTDHLWVGTEKGIDRLALNGRHGIAAFRHYGKAEGFTGIETIQNAVCKDSKGNLWFGSVRAATVFSPAKERPVRVPLVHLTGIQLFFDPIENTAYGRKLSPWYPVPAGLVLPYDQNHLSFDFIGIEHSNPEAVRYRWKLEGFDEKWSPVTARREAVFSNLPPGTYTFSVMAANEAGQWNEQPASFTFTIQPPFWRTWWFRMVFLVLLVALLWLLISWRYRRIRKENERQREKLEMEKNLIELEQKALRLQMNPHFLFNCLNSIKGLIAESKPEEAKIYLSRFSKLMRNVFDFSSRSFISLEHELEALKNYVALEKLSLGENLEFSVETSGDIEPSEMAIPPMLIQPFVENAIVHGLHSRKEKGRIEVKLRKEGEVLWCTVEDNGIGREEASKYKEPSTRSRLNAMAVTQERLNIIHKTLQMEEVKIGIIDLTSEDGLAAGTRVELSIPYKYL